MLAVIDNYDSFTYNLVQYFGELGADAAGVPQRCHHAGRAGGAGADAAGHLARPGRRRRMAASRTTPSAFSGRIPVLGVCLGHQCLGAVYGGQVVRAPRLMHGKTSRIYHHGTDLFAGLPSPFEATRYHSLIVEEPLPRAWK